MSHLATALAIRKAAQPSRKTQKTIPSIGHKDHLIEELILYYGNTEAPHCPNRHQPQQQVRLSDSISRHTLVAPLGFSAV